MKFARRLIIGLLALVILALAIVWLSLNSIVRSAVESQASAQLGVPTTLNGANVSIFGQKVSLSDLKIGSPKGYSAPHLFELGGTDVAVSVGQLRGTPVRVQSISINSPKLIIEQQNMKLNFKALIDGMPSAPTQADKTAEAKEPIKMIINHLTVTNAAVVIHPGEFPGVKLPTEITLSIPTLELENIGTADGSENGAAIKEVVVELITALVAKAADSDQLPAELRSLMKLDVNAISAQLHQEFNKQLDKVASEVTKKLPKEIGGVLDSSRLTTQPAKQVEDRVKGFLDQNKGRK